MEHCERKILRKRGEFPKEEGDAIRKHKAMHEENLLSSWLRKDGRGKEERTVKVEENEEERGERKSVEKEENETGIVKRRCDGSVEAFEIFSQGGDLESCGGLSWEDFVEKLEDLSDCEPDTRAHVRVVPDVTDVPVSSSSVITEFCEVLSCCSDWGDVDPQSFSFLKKRAHCCTSTQEVMRYESSQVKAPPMSRRRMTPPAPLPNSDASFERGAEAFRSGRPDVECEGKNDRCKNETVSGKK